MSEDQIKKIIIRGLESYQLMKDQMDISSLLPSDGVEKDHLILGLVRECRNLLYISELRLQGYNEKSTENRRLKEELDKTREYNEKLVKRIKEIEKQKVAESYLTSKPAFRGDIDNLTINTLLLNGYSKSEIAKKLGVSRQTVYRRLKEEK